MPKRHFFGSVTRRADLRTRPFEVRMVPRDEWRRADFVVGEVVAPHTTLARAELPSGRMIDLVEGDRMVGVLGERRATLEAVGDWRDIGPEGHMQALTTAGLFGKASFTSYFLGPLQTFVYRGHIVVGGEPVGMGDFAAEPEYRPYDIPTILIVGTSMSAGKTTSAKVLVRMLAQTGRKVAGAKITGAARYRDILAMHDAGADAIFDFVDVGLPSSIVPAEEYRPMLRSLLSMIVAEAPDVVVVEAGASPLEPYNGEAALEELGDSVKFTLLCASDPYAVVGVMQGFGFSPDLVSGVATATSAGVEIVEQLAGVRALSLLDRDSLPELRRMLEKALL